MQFGRGLVSVQVSDDGIRIVDQDTFAQVEIECDIFYVALQPFCLDQFYRFIYCPVFLIDAAMVFNFYDEFCSGRGCDLFKHCF